MFICSPADGHLSCFHVVAVGTNAAVDMCVQVSTWTYVFISLGYLPKPGIAESDGNSMFNFRGTAKLFSTTVMSFYRPSSSARGF